MFSRQLLQTWLAIGDFRNSRGKVCSWNLKANTIFLTIFIACENSLCFLNMDKFFFPSAFLICGIYSLKIIIQLQTDSFSLLKPFKKLHRLVINPEGTGQGEGDREDHGLGEEEGEQRGDEGRPGGVVVRDVQLAEVLQPLSVRPRPVEVSDGLGHLHSSLVSPHFKYLMTSCSIYLFSLPMLRSVITGDLYWAGSFEMLAWWRMKDITPTRWWF